MVSKVKIVSPFPISILDILPDKAKRKSTDIVQYWPFSIELDDMEAHISFPQYVSNILKYVN